MIQHLTRCPYCSSCLGFDWTNLKVVPNPDSVRPICSHVVWLVATMSLDSVDSAELNCFNQAHPKLSGMRDVAEVCELLGDIEMGAELDLGTVFSCDLPSLWSGSNVLDAFIVYAASPEEFLRLCLEDLRQHPRPPERGPIVEWWGPCTPIH